MGRLSRWGLAAGIAATLAFAPTAATTPTGPFAQIPFGEVFGRHGVPMLWIEPSSGRIVDANDAAAALYGQSVAQLRRQHIQDFNLLTEDQVAAERTRAATQNRSFFFFPHRVAGGAVHTVAVYSAPYVINGQQILLSMIVDLHALSALDADRMALDTKIQAALAQQRKALERVQHQRLWLQGTLLILLGGASVAVTTLFFRRRVRLAVAQKQAAIHALHLRDEWLQRLGQDVSSLQTAARTADIIAWQWDLHADRLQFDETSWEGLGIGLTNSANFDMAHWLDLIVPRDRSLFEHAWARHLAGQQPSLECELHLQSRDGREVPVLLRGQVVARADDGTPTRVIGILTDLSALRAYQQAASLAEMVFRHTHEAVLVTDPQSRIVRVNDAFRRLTDYAPDEVIGRNPSMLASGRHDRAFFAAMWNALQTQGHWSGEIWNRRRDGALMANWMTISVMRDPRGEVQGYVGVFHDITQRKQTEAELQRSALTDALTGLGNRVLLHDRLQQAMARTTRHGAYLAVVMLDLDGFKAINDTHGHAAGDRLLIALAQRLRALVREVDTVVRLGGDEFVLLLPDLIRPQDAEPLVQRILQAMAQPVDDAAGALQVSASVGVTHYPQEPPVDADTLLRQADEAMYWAKRSGRNRYAAWTPALANNGGTSLAATAGANHQP
jgi:diguanylate cyclase (GGDEF)-like protein/PAS domain S-box-containing protein